MTNGYQSFYKGSLLQIIDDITEANIVLEIKGASIPIEGVAGYGVVWTYVKDGKESHIRHFVRMALT